MFGDVDYHLDKLTTALKKTISYSQKLYDQGLRASKVGIDQPLDPAIITSYKKILKIADNHWPQYQTMAPLWMNLQGTLHFWQAQQKARPRC